MTNDRHPVRFELDKNMAQQLFTALHADGYRSFAEWVRERIRDYLREDTVKSFDLKNLIGY